MQAVQFKTHVHDGRIKIPAKYQKSFSSPLTVILLKEETPRYNDRAGDADVQRRLEAAKSLVGVLKGRDLDLDKARMERLSRQ
ncbi:MAG: hypothetical protein LBC67_01795 [Spirochaetales bacterium]|jgi:hypothetical protein|nr:hypothetical protein [Spirochaetales bacterium]